MPKRAHMMVHDTRAMPCDTISLVSGCTSMTILRSTSTDSFVVGSIVWFSFPISGVEIEYKEEGREESKKSEKKPVPFIAQLAWCVLFHLLGCFFRTRISLIVASALLGCRAVLKKTLPCFYGPIKPSPIVRVPTPVDLLSVSHTHTHTYTFIDLHQEPPESLWSNAAAILMPVVFMFLGIKLAENEMSPQGHQRKQGYKQMGYAPP